MISIKGRSVKFYPEEDKVERQYSVDNAGNEVFLGVKKGEFEVYSNYLFHQKSKNVVIFIYRIQPKIDSC